MSEITAKGKTTAEQFTRDAFLDIQSRDPSNFPIVEVLNVLSADAKGFTRYSVLAREAKEGRLDESSGAFDGLKGAYGEAIVLQSIRSDGEPVKVI
jgi:hypothetical protein